MLGLSAEEKSPRARLAELKAITNIRAPKVQTERRTAGIGVVVEQSLTEHTEHTGQSAQLECNIHGLKVGLDFLEHCKTVCDLLFSMQHDEFDLLKCQVASGGVCIEEMVQQLRASASDDFAALIDDLNLHAAHAQKAVQNTFCSRSVTIAKRPQIFLQ